MVKVGILHNLYKAESMNQLHTEDTWIPGGVQMESRWIYGVHLETVGEGKVQSIKYRW